MVRENDIMYKGLLKWICFKPNTVDCTVSDKIFRKFRNPSLRFALNQPSYAVFNTLAIIKGVV